MGEALFPGKDRLNLAFLIGAPLGVFYQWIKNFLARNLFNYFNLHVCLSFQPSVIISIPAIGLQNATNKTCLVCVKSENMHSWSPLYPLGTSGKEKLSHIHYVIR